MHLFETGVTDTSHGAYIKGLQESLKPSREHARVSAMGTSALGGPGSPLPWEYARIAHRDVPGGPQCGTGAGVAGLPPLLLPSIVSPAAHWTSTGCTGT